MQPDDVIRLRHMLDAARRAMGFVEHRSRDELDDDCQLVSAHGCPRPRIGSPKVREVEG